MERRTMSNPTPPKPLKRLLAECTPGNWSVSPCSGRVIMAGDKRIGEANCPNAELIARCNPQVMAAVLEALERAESMAKENLKIAECFSDNECIDGSTADLVVYSGAINL